VRQESSDATRDLGGLGHALAEVLRVVGVPAAGREVHDRFQGEVVGVISVALGASGPRRLPWVMPTASLWSSPPRRMVSTSWSRLGSWAFSSGVSVSVAIGT